MEVRRSSRRNGMRGKIGDVLVRPERLSTHPGIARLPIRRVPTRPEPPHDASVRADLSGNAPGVGDSRRDHFPSEARCST
jgi:hypothetical protein